MLGVVIHAPKDLRVEEIPAASLGPHDVQVRIESGGICGSDLHYYHHGGFGTVRIREPMALGHEIAGTVEKVGAEVSRVSPGQRHRHRLEAALLVDPVAADLMAGEIRHRPGIDDADGDTGEQDQDKQKAH